MDNFIKKITSRKFIVTVVIIAAGIGATLKNTNNEKMQVVGIVIAGCAAIAYQVIEGNIDKASVAKEAKNIIDIIEGVEISPCNISANEIIENESTKED